MATKTNTTINGKKYFRVSASFGTNADGKLIRKYFYGKSEKEARKKMEEYKLSLREGLALDSDVRLGVSMKIWLFEYVRNSVKASAFDRYECTFRNYIENAPFTSKYIKDIKGLEIQRYYNDMFKNGKTTSTIKRVNKLLKRFFKYGIAEGLLIRNPCDNIKIPCNKQSEQKEVEVFSKEELKIMMNLDYPYQIKDIALTSLATGMRQGEVLGLKWDVIDFENKEINIQRTVSCYTEIINGERKTIKKIQSPKTKNSIRKIPLPTSLIPILQKIKNRQKINKIRYGADYNITNEGFIFLTYDGNILHKSNVNNAWATFLKRCNIPHKKFHTLRHTYATLQFENNIPLKTVSNLLGHSSINITADIYTHVLKKEKEKATDILTVLKM